jgi:3-dehydroquinate dehydratase II
MTKLMVIHGPNLHLLGQRQTQIYGTLSLDDINFALQQKAKHYGYELLTKQSNSEAEIIDYITANYNDVDFLIFNPAAFTHTSIAIYDTLLATELQFIEVHLSSPAKREQFRHQSYFSKIALGTICGLGANSYILALEALKLHIEQQSTTIKG